MTLNGVMAFILRYLTEFGSFLDRLRKNIHYSHEQNALKRLWSAWMDTRR